MPKDRELEPPKPQYEGIRWLGSQWGRSGNAVPAKIGAWFATLVTGVVWYLAVGSYLQEGPSTWVLGNALVGVLTAVTAGFYFAEAHFAARVSREQEPLRP
jgi:hypothetical protein